LTAGTQDPPAAQPPKPRAQRRRRRVLVLWILLALLAAAAAIARFGAVTPSGRAFVEGLLDGAKLGPYGHVHVEGLQGDIWGDFTLRRLTINDAYGAWLDARQVRLRWNWLALLQSKASIDAFDARLVTVIRGPEVEPTARTAGRASLSLHVDKFAARLELLPAFSSRYGLYDVTGGFDLRREGGMAGRAQVSSLTHAGDHLDADFDLGRDKTIRLALQAREAGGGALAGALGLAADQPFLVSANASGTTSRGRFHVESRSGPLVPIAGDGGWTPQGGQASGRITLAASKYLIWYQQALGPEIRFGVSGARAGDGLETIAFSATSDNVDVSARGEADLGRRIAGPAGLQVQILARQGQRLLGFPQMGAARVTGTLTGRADRWSLAGPLEADGPSAFDYRLAQVRGPARFDWIGDQLAVQASLDGAGGAGHGVAAALLGGRPHVTTQLLWLPDGHMLIKSLAVLGPGLKVDAQGQRNVFGGLSFKGQATFTNFVAAHAGAKGLMTATWSASQASAQPWQFSFDAKAKGFASGWGEADRLLGDAPELKGQAAWGARGIELMQADLTGAAGAASAVGLIGSDSALALKLGWSAKGPLEVGPLEISGAGKGSGALTGTLANPRADLTADFGMIDLPALTLTDAHVTVSFLKGPADTNGAFSLAATSRYGAAHAETGFRFIGDGLELTGLAAEAGGAHASGSLALRRGAPSSADLTVSVGPGAFLTRGQASGRLLIVQAGQGAHASLKLSANGAMTRAGLLVQTANFSAEGPLERMPYHIAASGFSPHGSWKADGGGTLDGVGGAYAATFEGQGRVRNADFRTLAPAELKLGDQAQTLSLLVNVGGGKAKIDARQGGGALHATADLTGVSLGLLDQDFVGQFDAEISLQGQGPRLDGVMQARLAGAGEKGAASEPKLDGVVNAALAGPTMTIDAQLGNSQGLASHAHLVLPAVASAAPFRIALVRTAPMKGDFAADGEVKPLWDLLMGGERSLAGKVHAVGTLGGTLADPQARGEATIAAGQFTDSATGLKLTDVSLAAQLDQNAIDVSQFTGKDGASGQVSGSGRVSLQRAGASSFHLDLTRFRLIDNDLATAIASGQATISRGADGAVKLTGALSIDRADVAANPLAPSGVTSMDVTEINRQPGAGGGHLQAVNSNAPAVGLDVTLKAAHNVFLKGRGLNVELSLDAQVTGSTAAPVLAGAARVVRGDYDFAGKRFQFDNRGVVYLATSADDIRLDLTATRDDPSLTAVIRIEGTASKPKITLTSTPVLPNDEVLSQVLFGASASQLSPLDAAELASAMTSLAGGSGFDVVGNLRSFAHLDRLALGGDTTGAIVSGGKYVTDNIYLEITGGATGPTGAVEWRVRKDLSIVSRIAGSVGDSQIEVRWRKDY